MWLNLLLTLSILLRSYGSAPAAQTYAVIIGISDYKELTYETGDLRFADRDARRFAAFLQSRSGGGVPASHIRLLINAEATQTAILNQLSLFQLATDADRIILYFSGHGLPNSFVPVDMRPGDDDKLLTYKDIKDAFRHSRAKTKLCIADACLSGGMIQRLKNQRNPDQIVVSSTNDKSNVAMLLASRSTQSAVEDSRLAGGVFTHFLLQGLSGKGDLDGNRIVTIRELYKYVSPELKSRTRGRQTPIFYGRFSDNLPMAFL